jgi:hypothetical protein
MRSKVAIFLLPPTRRRWVRSRGSAGATPRLSRRGPSPYQRSPASGRGPPHASGRAPEGVHSRLHAEWIAGRRTDRVHPRTPTSGAANWEDWTELMTEVALVECDRPHPRGRAGPILHSTLSATCWLRECRRRRCFVSAASSPARRGQRPQSSQRGSEGLQSGALRRTGRRWATPPFR